MRQMCIRDRYTLSYEYEKQNDLIESYSLGFAGSVGYTTEAMKVIEGSLRLGYSGMTDHFQANHYSTEYTTEFAATGYDSVVLYRIPVTFYLYSIWNPEKKEWVESGLGTAYAEMCIRDRQYLVCMGSFDRGNRDGVVRTESVAGGSRRLCDRVYSGNVFIKITLGKFFSLCETYLPQKVALL